MQNRVQQFDTIDQPWAWTAEIGSGIHDVEIRPPLTGPSPRFLTGPALSEFIDGAIDGKATGHEDDDIGVSGFHCSPCRFARWAIWSP